ncbi:Helix-loop-helix DNA-binding protein [Ophiocordyceps sinensis CO18]|uniref:Helix-loop-helix DNA-binding protein n=1 Tax=Ophiocordyceps sinensis (strain Co18 / CGMCC 3.14243) TaxID=911162 RepID=T5A713_OPHSC|nr:Helix-loop-helix DNA-binding protein [Ophiocordyceps sinensis CO18]
MPVMPTGRGAPATGNKAASAGGTDAAGRKLARKTAHSLIERRRRSKMNEEFAVLKAMIPACTGEMHKLAILQASIEYVRYLQDCVAKLKAKHDDDHGRGNATHDPPLGDFHPTLREDPAAGEAEMTDSDMASPNQADNVDTHRLPSISPALWAQDHHSHRRHSYLRNSRDHGQHGYSMSACTSPAFGPQRSIHHVPGRASASASTLTSPMLLQCDFVPKASPAFGPQRSIHHVPGRASASESRPTSPMLHQCDFVHEASSALLMLNNDGRDSHARGRGLSVRDLLSADV